MASYDTLGLTQNEGTKPVARSGIRLRYASNGTVRARAQTSALRIDWQLFHRAISETQWAALKSFHESNRGVTFTVTLGPDGTALTCLFADKPFDVSPMPGTGGNTLFDVTVYLVQAT